MLDSLIRFSLRNRPLVLIFAVVVLVFGFRTARELPLEVLPDMTKPTVTLLTECPGLAPEEVEILVTRRLEAALQGVGGLDRLRSNSDVGLSLVFAEFAWGTTSTAPGSSCRSGSTPSATTSPKTSSRA